MAVRISMTKYNSAYVHKCQDEEKAAQEHGNDIRTPGTPRGCSPGVITGLGDSLFMRPKIKYQ